MRSRALRGSLVACLGLVACSAVLAVFDGCTIVNGLTVPSDAAEEPRGLDAGSPDGDTCAHALPPPKPNIPDTPGDRTVVVVAKRFTTGASDILAPVGFDLDNSCSCPPAVAQPCVSRKDHCDLAGGRDNATGRLFNTLLGVPTSQKLDLEERVNNGIRAGKNTILIRVLGYNGTPEDPEVTVQVFATLGYFGGGAGTTFVPPRFTADERWALDSRQFTVTPDVPKATTGGYVTGGKLVATLDVTLDLSDNFSVALTGAILQADLAFPGGGGSPTITGGLLAGRWPISDVLRIAGGLRLQDGGKLICETPIAYATIKDLACQEVDLVANRADENKGVACDALSVALLFEAAPASLGEVRTPNPAADCPDAQPDDCTKEAGL